MIPPRSLWCLGLAILVLAGPAAAQETPAGSAEEQAGVPAQFDAAPVSRVDGRALVTARLYTLRNDSIGSVTLRETPNGTLLVLSANGLPAGVHGLHIHERGVCEPPFESAGGHWNPSGVQHGYMDQKGPHAGDLPNLHVGPNGLAMVELFLPAVRIGSLTQASASGATQGTGQGAPLTLRDGDGASLVVHAQPDDYTTNPAGASGDRIACAVLMEAGG